MTTPFLFAAPLAASVAVIASGRDLATFTAFCAIGAVVGLWAAYNTGVVADRRKTTLRVLCGLVSGIASPRALHWSCNYFWPWTDVLFADPILQVLAGFICGWFGYWIWSAGLSNVASNSDGMGKVIGDAAMKGFGRVLDHKTDEVQKGEHES